MKKVKFVIILYMCFFTCLLTASCSSDKFEDKTINFSTKDSVSTFDPQLAETSAEITIANNCFEGLLTKDESGKIVKGMAESYTVSNDRTVYSFKIRKNALWSDGETPVTAEDFEFGIKRAVMKQTSSPYVSLLFNIKNAKKINSGKMKISKLGVKAQGDILTIRLNKQDDSFEETLTHPLCYPCNKAFFNGTNGKYGLSNKQIISNGAFCISYYNTETNTVIIQKNSDYNGKYKAIPKSVSVSYANEYEDIYSYFEKKETDIGTIECSYLKSLEEFENKNKLFYNTNYCLYLSDKLVSSSGSDLKKALVTDIDSNTINANITDYYKPADGIIPSINTINGECYREKAGKINLIKYSKKKAENFLGNYNSASERLNGLSIYYSKDDNRLSLLSNLIVQGWQRDLNVYINSKEEDLQTILNGIKNNEILMAVIPISSESNNAVSSFNCLSELGITEAVYNCSINELFEKEQSLVKAGIIYPIVSIPTAASYSKDIAGFSISSDGKVIDFRFIRKS